MNITADDLKSKVLDQLNQKSQDIIRRTVVAGQQILFNEKTHNQVFDDMTGGQGDISVKLGNGIAHIMLVLFDQSKASMPKGALIPAGAILLSNAAEFADKGGIAPVDDATFGEALQAMSVKVFDRFDSEFRQKVSRRTGKQLSRNQPQQAQTQQQLPAPPTGGLIQSQGSM